jgi:hypothetical protein
MNIPESANLNRDEAGYRVSPGARNRASTCRIIGLQRTLAWSRS